MAIFAIVGEILYPCLIFCTYIPWFLHLRVAKGRLLQCQLYYSQTHNWFLLKTSWFYSDLVGNRQPWKVLVTPECGFHRFFHRHFHNSLHQEPFGIHQNTDREIAALVLETVIEDCLILLSSLASSFMSLGTYSLCLIQEEPLTVTHLRPALS